MPNNAWEESEKRIMGKESSRNEYIGYKIKENPKDSLFVFIILLIQ